MYPHNVADRPQYFFYPRTSKMPTLIVGSDGKWKNSEGRYYTAEDSYKEGHNLSIESMRNVAQAHNVGFIVDNFGIGGRKYTGTTMADYVSDMIAFFEKEKIPYSYAYFFGPRHIANETGDFQRNSKASTANYIQFAKLTPSSI